jgi:hypothetical protein
MLIVLCVSVGGDPKLIVSSQKHNLMDARRKDGCVIENTASGFLSRADM